jgi:hypothetical protein
MYALGLTGGLSRNGVAGSFFEHVEAAFVCAHPRTCGPVGIGQVAGAGVVFCLPLPTRPDGHQHRNRTQWEPKFCAAILPKAAKQRQAQTLVHAL